MDTIERLTKKREETEKIMSNTTYIEWLIQFTQDKESFYDDDWSYFPEKISESDKENVEKLRLFYDGINKYAENNYIYPTSYNCGEFHKVKLNDFHFEIGYMAGQGVLFFFRKAPLEDDKEFIDFNDIITGKEQDYVKQYRARLKSLPDLIMTEYETGIPIKAIKKEVYGAVEKIESQEEAKKAKPKKLVRTNENS